MATPHTQATEPGAGNPTGTPDLPWQNNELFASAFRRNPSLMTISRLDNGALVEVNDAFCNKTGFTRRDVIGRTSIELGVINPDDRNELKELIQSEGIVAGSGLTLYRKDKTPIHCLYHGEIISSGSTNYVLSISIDISDRIVAEEALKESEQKFRTLFNSTSNGMFLLNLATRKFVMCNVACATMLGYSREELISMDFTALHPPEDLPDILSQMARVTAGEQGHRKEIRFRQKDGGILVSDLSASVISISGHPTILVDFRDITRKKRLERERDAIIEILRLINSASDLHELIRVVTLYLQQWSGCEAIGIRIKDGDDYPYFETRGFPPEFVEAERTLCARDDQGYALRDASGNPVLECMCGNILQGRFDPSKPFFTARGSFWSNCTTELLASTTEADRQTRTRNRCNGEGYESVALVALRYGNDVIGLIQLNDKRRNRFTQESMATVERIADSLAIALVQRHEAQELRESEMTLRSFFDSPGLMRGIIELENGNIRHIADNDSAAKIFGLTKEEMRGRLDSELGIPGETIRRWREHYEQSRQSNAPVSFDYAHGDAPNTRHFTAIVSYLGHGKAGHRYAYAVTDNTDRQRAEEASRKTQQALSESDAMNRLMTECSPVALFLHRNGRFLHLNPAALRLLHASRPEDLVGKPVIERVHPDYRTLVTQRIDAAQRSGVLADLVNEKFVCLDGDIIDVNVIGTPIVYKGENTVLVFAMNITEQKRTEVRLQEQLAELRRWQHVMLGREARVLDLKREVNELLIRAGQPPKYDSAQETAHEV